jgi:hypothetical protein
MSDTPISRERLLEEKRDYSPFLVHLTKSTINERAKDILCRILDDQALLSYHAWCIWYKSLEQPENAELCQKFKVVCFTETPLDQIEILLQKVERRLYQPEPYGLVFKKTYIRSKGGNPVFYVTREIAKPLSAIYEKQTTSIEDSVCRLLALTTFCDNYNDWHWEREWRIVGELHFQYEDVYCALCPEDDIPFFEKGYDNLTFIDPRWRMNKILDQLVKKARKYKTTPEAELS